jgi:hypothetical protein
MSHDLSHAPVLHEGAHGEWVHYLQQLLETAGYSPGAINSSMGGGTITALRNYQKAVRDFKGHDYLSEDGYAGPQTWHALSTSAHIHETLQDSDAILAHDRDYQGGDAHKMEAGGEVGRQGWQRGTLTLNVWDFRGELHNGHAYVRFVGDDDADSSDEGGDVVGGTLSLPHVWMPGTGTLHLTVATHQNNVDHASGNFRIEHWKDHMQLAVQQESERHNMTRHELHQRGWSEDAKVSAGIDIEVVSIGGEVHAGHSGSHQESMDEEVPVIVAKASLAIRKM